MSEATLAYESRGSGDRLVVLLHGFLGSGRNLSSLGRKLCDANSALCAILPDLNGHGASPAHPANADVQDVAASVWALLDAHWPGQQVRVVGHSMGGRVALAMLAARPAQLDRAVILDMTPSPMTASEDRGDVGGVLRALLHAPAQAPNRATMRLSLLEQGLSEALADWLLQSLQSGEGGVSWRIDRNFLNTFFARMRGDDWWDVVRAQPRKLYWVRGDRSAYVSQLDQERLRAAAIPCETLTDAGHFVHIDQPAALLAVLQNIL